MIHLDDGLYVGDSSDGEQADLTMVKIGAILNVAHDLQTKRYKWGKVEYMKVGLIDGPGNELVDYCTAVLSLVTLLRRHERVMVYDHDGCRALVVCMMYLNLVKGKRWPHSFSGNHTIPEWSHWLTWEERLATIDAEERPLLPEPHHAHLEAFAKIPYGLLEAFL